MTKGTKIAVVLGASVGLFLFIGQVTNKSCEGDYRARAKERFFSSETRAEYFNPAVESNRASGAGLDLDELKIRGFWLALDDNRYEYSEGFPVQRWSLSDCRTSDVVMICIQKGLEAFRCGKKSIGGMQWFKIEYPFSGTYRGVHLGDHVETAKKSLMGGEKIQADSQGRVTEIEWGTKGGCMVLPAR
jgi:hypothetical protein